MTTDTLKTMSQLIGVSIGSVSPDQFEYGPVDWPELFESSNHHQVARLVNDGIQKLAAAGKLSLLSPDYYSPEIKPQRFNFYNNVISAEKKSQAIFRSVVSLNEVLDEHEVDVFLFKGLSLAFYYPVPKLRDFGDVDIYACNGDPDALRDLMLSAGANVKHDSPKHLEMKMNGVVFELHRFFLWDFFMPRYKVMNRLINESISDSRPIGDMRHVFRPSLKFDELFVLEHAANHLRTEGIILRHVLDWAMIMRSKEPAVDWALVRRLGLERFAGSMNSLANKYFNVCIAPQFCNDNLKDVESLESDMCSYIENNTLPYERGVRKLLWKVKRYFARLWTYKLTDFSIFRSLVRVLVSHIKEPDQILG